MSAGHYTDNAVAGAEFLEIYRGKISAHRAKAGYTYPTLRLPFACSELIGQSTRIYKTMYDEVFLVVVTPVPAAPKTPTASINDAKSSKNRVNTLRKLQSNQVVQMLEKLCFSPFRNCCTSGNIMTASHSPN